MRDRREGVFAALAVLSIVLAPTGAVAGSFCVDEGPPGTPQAISPAGQLGDGEGNPTFVWSCVNWMTHTRIIVEDGRGWILPRWLSVGPGLGDQSCIDTNGQCFRATCQYTPDTDDYRFDLAPGPTDWRVASHCGPTAGIPGPNGGESQIQTFFIQSDQEPVTEMLAPLSSTSFSNPLFQWEPGLDATWYKLLVKAPGNSSLVYYESEFSAGAAGCADGFSTCTRNANLNLTVGTTFIWTVQSYGPNGYGPLSEIQEVTVVEPPDPIFDDDFELGDLDGWSEVEPPIR